MTFKKVAVVGAGTMGIGVTVDLLYHRIDVVLVDNSESNLKKAQKEIAENLRLAPLLYKKKLSEPVDEILKRVEFSLDLESVKGTQFVIENVTEDWEIKKDIYIALDSLCEPDVCFGVDTSCLSITKIASVTERPDKIIGIHFMNPSLLKPVIEVMKGTHTSDWCIETSKRLLEQMEKEVILVNDFPGFVSNRASHLFMNEAIWILQDGVAEPKQIDDIFKRCFGHKMGPLETADLIGLDTVMHSLDVLYESYHDPKFRCCPLLRKKVDAGELGRKSGKGIYEYSTVR